MFTYAIADLNSWQQSTTGNASSSLGAVTMSMAFGPAKISLRVSTTGRNHYLTSIRGIFWHGFSVSSYMHDTWNNVPNTINYNNINENGGRNKDGAKIYVGWAKHAMFDNRDTSWTDEIFQGCGREYRSNDWWWAVLQLFSCPSKTAYTGFDRYLPEKSDLICAGNGCAAGNDIARFSWGSADSTPLVAAGVVCLAEEGGSAGCKILDVIFPPK